MNNNVFKRLIILPALLIIIICSCAKKPDQMEYEMVFHTELGTDEGQIGSNLEMLKNAFENDEEFYIGDYLDTADNFMLYKDNLYVADTGNHRVQLFKLTFLSSNQD